VTIFEKSIEGREYSNGDVPTFSGVAFILKEKELRFPPEWARDLIGDRIQGVSTIARNYGQYDPDIG